MSDSLTTARYWTVGSRYERDSALILDYLLEKLSKVIFLRDFSSDTTQMPAQNILFTARKLRPGSLKAATDIL